MRRRRAVEVPVKRMRLSAANGDEAVAVSRQWLTDLVNGLAQPFNDVLTPLAATRVVQIADVLGIESPSHRLRRAWLPNSHVATAVALTQLAISGAGTHEAAKFIGVPRDLAYLWLQSKGIDLWPCFVANDKHRERGHDDVDAEDEVVEARRGA